MNVIPLYYLIEREYMINKKDQETLKNALLLDNRINTKQVIVASMRTNQSIKLLSAKLDKLNYIVNYRLNRYFPKRNSNKLIKFLKGILKLNTRVIFYSFPQLAFNNTHAHIYLSVPPKYDFDSVVNMMKDEWKKLDDRFDVKFDIHSETVQFEERYASYSVREFDIYNPNTFEVI